MGVGELTDRGSVLRAIREYDEIGREAFLAKYHFGESRAFWLLHEGNQYDSKAIVGAAFGYQFPERGPLAAHDFSGGDNTVKRVLEDLGFVVEVHASPAQIRRWIGGLQVGSLPGGGRAPHKHLLVLMAMRRVADGHPRLEPVVEVGAALAELLREALPDVDEPSPWEPIWRLEEELWEITDPNGQLVRPGNTDPPIARLRQPDVVCGFSDSVYATLKSFPDAREKLEDEVATRYLSDLSPNLIERILGRSPAVREDVWWVNQGRTYRQERDGGYVWAPLVTKTGRPVDHHTAVSRLGVGDVIVHYSDGAIRALGRVARAGEVAPRPAELPEDPWAGEGYRAEVEYFELTSPIPLEDLTDRPFGEGPFTASGGVKQGYFFGLGNDWAGRLRSRYVDRWPPGSPWSQRKHWLFQSNPQKWDLAKRLETWQVGEVEPWTLMRYSKEVADGDDVLLFVSGQQGGIFALGTIVGEPVLRPRPEWLSEGPEEQLSIGVRLVRRLQSPIGRSELKEHPVLSNLAVLKFANATNFTVTDDEWNAVMKLLEGESAPQARCLVVYIGQSSESNLAFSLPNGRWGWRTHQPDYATVSPGDLIILGVGFTGGSPRVQRDEFARHQFDRLIIGRVTTPVIEDRVPYWPDERTGSTTYPFRVDFESIEERTGVDISKLDAELGGAVGEAFRLSALGGGKGVVVDIALEPPQRVLLELSDVVECFAEDLRVSGYDYGGSRHEELVRSFVTSLATKRFVILTGLSGSGKTKIAQHFGNWLGTNALKIVAVRPDWTNPDPLLGYENGLSELKENGYAWHVPPALKIILRAHQRPNHPHLLLLDEMNLAHVERYFADVLSGMESDDGIIPNLKFENGEWRYADPEVRHLPFPTNLFIVGTVNIDETTYMFSPKVLDRANTLELRVATEDLQLAQVAPLRMSPAPPSFPAAFLAASTRPAVHTGSGELVGQWLKELHGRLLKFGREFGHRTFAEATRFADLLAAAGDHDALTALDFQVLQKVLPKFHGSIRELSEPLNDLGAWCLFGPGSDVPSGFDAAQDPAPEAVLPRSFDKIHRMARRLRANHFVSFAE